MSVKVCHTVDEGTVRALDKDEYFSLARRNRVSELRQRLQNASEEELKVLNSVESHGWTMVHMAAKNGSLEMLKLLVEYKAPCLTPTANELGTHPIHLACSTGHVAIAEFLIDKGEDINVRDYLGNTPLIYAALDSHLEAVDALVKLGAKVAVRDHKGLSLAHLACLNGNVILLQKLATLGVTLDPELAEGDPSSPLMLACSADHFHVAAFLAKQGASLQRRDDNGFTALHWASTAPSPACASLLVYLGADINATTKEMETPLHIACKAGSLAVIEFFLQSTRSSMSVVDSKGNRPLHYVDLHGFVPQVSSGTTALRAVWGARQPLFLLTPTFFAGLISGFGSGGTASLLAFSVPWVIGVLAAVVWSLRFLNHQLLSSSWWPLLWFGVLLQVVMWATFLACWLMDPGTLDPRDEELKKEYLEEIERNAPTLTPLTLPTLKLCATCHIERPVRSKHCPICGHCVLLMDHHCAFVGNCIGKRNWTCFYFYVLSVVLAIAVHLTVAVVHWHLVKFDLLVFVSMLVIGPFVVPTSGLLAYQTWLVKGGLLANEHANWFRYDHMMTEGSQFYNPFDRGVRSNVMSRVCPSWMEKRKEYETVEAVEV